MRKLVLFSFAILLLFMISCSGKRGYDPKDAPSEAMLDALHKLDAHDYDAYLACVATGDEDDSVHMELYRQILNQHQEYQEKSKGNVDRYEVVDVKFASASVCTVLYRLVFSDSTKEVSSQKMVRVGDNWKIKIRN